jgi:hypothetical protein
MLATAAVISAVTGHPAGAPAASVPAAAIA